MITASELLKSRRLQHCLNEKWHQLFVQFNDGSLFWETPSTCYRLLPRVGLIGLKREGLPGSLAFLPKWPRAERPPPLRRPPRVPEPIRLLPSRCLPLVSAANRACTCCFLRCSASFFSCSRAAIALPTRLFLLAPLQDATHWISTSLGRQDTWIKAQTALKYL